MWGEHDEVRGDKRQTDQGREETAIIKNMKGVAVAGSERGGEGVRS